MNQRARGQRRHRRNTNADRLLALLLTMLVAVVSVVVFRPTPAAASRVCNSGAQSNYFDGF